VPSRIGYDNLKPAVKKLVGNGRQLQQRFVALANHYRFEPVFARPYTGHDKGAVEARGKGFRGQYLTPIPRGRTLLDVAADLVLDLDEHQQDEVRHLQPLPAVDFIGLRPMNVRNIRTPKGCEFDARRHVVASVSSRTFRSTVSPAPSPSTSPVPMSTSSPAPLPSTSSAATGRA